MDDMRIGYRQGGQLLFIVTVLMGISLFVGSRVIDRWAPAARWRSRSAASRSTAFLPSFAEATRSSSWGARSAGSVTGLGSGAQGVLVTERFPPARRGLINTINAAVNALSIAAAYAVTVPLYRFFHSWRGTLLFWSLVSAAWMGIFILFDAAHAPAAARRAVQGARQPCAGGAPPEGVVHGSRDGRTDDPVHGLLLLSALLSRRGGAGSPCRPPGRRPA